MGDLPGRFSRHLPKGVNYNLLHVRSQTIETAPLVNYRNEGAQKHTLKSKHFLTLSDERSLILFGIEVFVYLVVFEDYVDRYIFVSKCDTTGFQKSFKLTHLISEYLQWLIEIDTRTYCQNVKLKNITTNKEEKIFLKEPKGELSENQTINALHKVLHFLKTDPDYYKSIKYYTDDLLQGINSISDNCFSINVPSEENIKISFFTRPADQYLFPKSAKNKHKHVVDGKQLLNWWIKVVDESLIDEAWDCKLTIPGSDRGSIARFIQQMPKWTIGNIHHNERRDGLAINNIPLFPDDPKGRFLEHLVVENRYKSVSKDQFWNELGFRQEFRLGSLVGIIGCEFKNRSLDNTPINSLDNFITVKNYKKLHTLFENEDFSNTTDVAQLVDTKIPHLLRQANLSNTFVPITGIKEISVNSSIKRKESPNILSSLVKKKTKPNDLTSLVKKKDTNDLTASVKKKEPNDLNSLVKKKNPKPNDLTSFIKKKKN